MANTQIPSWSLEGKVAVVTGSGRFLPEMYVEIKNKLTVL